MRCPSCDREQEEGRVLCAECWRPLHPQPPCTGDIHFWHVREQAGRDAVYCFYCKVVAGEVPTRLGA